MKLDNIQQGVVDDVVLGKIGSLFLTGRGGSGKSEIIKKIAQEAMLIGRRTLLLAPTNAAAKNIGGVTIHKAFGLNLEINEEATVESDVYKVMLSKDKLYQKFEKLNIKPTDIVVIDEISMGGKLLAKVIGALRTYEKEVNSGLSTLLLVGDPEQLPPVKDSAVDWSAKCNKTVRLEINYRTANLSLAKEIQRYRETKNEDIVKRVPTAPNIRTVGFREDTTYIAYKNATLATMQSILLGDIKNWVKRGDRVTSFGSSSNHHVIITNPLTGVNSEYPYFTTGDVLKVVGNAVPIEHEGLFEVAIKNEAYDGFTVYDNNEDFPSPKVVLTGDYKLYKKVLAQLFHPINNFKKEMYEKYSKATKVYELKQLFTPREKATWNKLWVAFFNIKNRPFARHSQFISAHKAQGQSIENVVVMWDEMVGDKLKYVAISRAKENLVLVTKKGY